MIIHLNSVLLLDVPVSGLVYGYVTAWPLQQLFLCLSSAGHRYGRQNPAHHPVLCNSQWQTGTALR